MKSLPVELKKVRDTVAACGWRECVKSIDSILVGAGAASILKSTAAIKFQFFGIIRMTNGMSFILISTN